MNLTVLSDNTASAPFLSEHGLSFLIESEGKSILFDTGASDVFLKNADLLNCNIEKDIDTVVLSHGHWDHGNGLQQLSGKNLVAHPDVHLKRFRAHDHSYIGLSLDRDDLLDRYKITYSSDPCYISNNILFLGEIPRKNSFESKTSSFIDNSGKPDFVPDDSALVIIENNQLYIISGCAHSGICNILDFAIQVTGCQNIAAVIGGFHLKTVNKQANETLSFLLKQKVKSLYPGHCTSNEVIEFFREQIFTTKLHAGLVLNI